MKTAQNAHNGPIFQFHMKVKTYLRRLGKEKIISIQRQSEKINLMALPVDEIFSFFA